MIEILSTIFLLFCAYNLKLNGERSTTINRGDSLILEVEFEKTGAIASLEIYLDKNKNGKVDSPDLRLTKERLFDGGWKDEDEKKNGIYKEVIKHLYWIPEGNFVVRVEDHGVKSEASLKVVVDSTNFSISGKIKGLPNPSDIGVIVALDTLRETARFSALSDNEGNYTIYIPDSLGNRKWFILGMDIFVKNPGYLAKIDTQKILVDGHVKKDIEFEKGDTKITISGKIIDNQEKTIDIDSALITVFGGIIPINFYLATGYSLNGEYSIPIKPGIGYWSVQPQVKELIPDYLQPWPRDTFGIFLKKVEEFNLLIFKADTIIKGSVWYKDGTPADEIEILAEDTSFTYGIGTGFTSTGTFSDGHYCLKVSKDASGYKVALDTTYLRKDCIPEKVDTIVPPGAEGVDFYLPCVLGIEEGKKEFKISLIQTILIKRNEKIPFQLENIKIYDALGRRVAKKEFNFSFLCPGVYFLKREDKLIKLVILP